MHTFIFSDVSILFYRVGGEVREGGMKVWLREQLC